MEPVITYLIVIVVILVGLGVFLAYEFSSLNSDVHRMYMNSASDYTVRHAKKEIITEMECQIDKVMIEIACLATKNNADIQRVREGYKPGDVIEHDGDQYMVLKINRASTVPGRIVDVYHLYDLTDGEVSGADRDVIDKNSKLLRHVDLRLGEDG